MDREVLKELLPNNLGNVPVPTSKSAHKPRTSILRAFDPCYASPAKPQESDQLKRFNTKDENVLIKNSITYALINFDKTFQEEPMDFEESQTFHEAMDITYDANKAEQFEDAQSLVDSNSTFPLNQNFDAPSLKHHVEGIVDEIIGTIQESSTVPIDLDKAFDGRNNSPKVNKPQILNSTVNWNRTLDCFNDPLGVCSMNKTFDGSPKSPIEPVQIKSDAHKVNDILPLEFLPKSVELNSSTEEQFVPLNTSQVNIFPETLKHSSETSPSNIPEGTPKDLRMEENDVKFQYGTLNSQEVTISPTTPIKSSETSPNKNPEAKPEDLPTKDDDVKFQNVLPLNPPELTISPATPIKSSEASPNKNPEAKPEDLPTKDDDVKLQNVPLNPPEVTISPATPIKSSEASPNKNSEEKPEDLPTKDDDVKFQNVPPNPPEVTISPATPIKSSEASPNKIIEEKQKDLPKEEDSVTWQDVPLNPPEVTISPATPIKSSEASPSKIPGGKPKDLPNEQEQSASDISSATKSLEESSSNKTLEGKPMLEDIPTQQQSFDMPVQMNKTEDICQKNLDSTLVLEEPRIMPKDKELEKSVDIPVTSRTSICQNKLNSAVMLEDQLTKMNKTEDVCEQEMNSGVVLEEQANTRQSAGHCRLLITEDTISPATPIKSSEASPSKIPEEKPEDLPKEQEQSASDISPATKSLEASSSNKTLEGTPMLEDIPTQQQSFDLPTQRNKTEDICQKNLDSTLVLEEQPIMPKDNELEKSVNIPIKSGTSICQNKLNSTVVLEDQLTKMNKTEDACEQEMNSGVVLEEQANTRQSAGHCRLLITEDTISPATPIKSSEASPSKIPEEKPEDLPKEQEQSTSDISPATKSLEASSSNKILEGKPMLEDIPTQQQSFDLPTQRNKTEDMCQKNLDSTLVLEEQPIMPKDNELEKSVDIPVKSRTSICQNKLNSTVVLEDQLIKMNKTEDVSEQEMNSGVVLEEQANTRQSAGHCRLLITEDRISSATPIKSSEASPSTILEEKPKDLPKEQEQPTSDISPATKSLEASSSNKTLERKHMLEDIPTQRQSFDMPMQRNKTEDICQKNLDSTLVLEAQPVMPKDNKLEKFVDIPVKSRTSICQNKLNSTVVLEDQLIKMKKTEDVCDQEMNAGVVLEEKANTKQSAVSCNDEPIKRIQDVEVSIKNTQQEMVSHNALPTKSKKMEQLCRKDFNAVQCDTKPIQEKIVHIRDPKLEEENKKLLKEAQIYKHKYTELQNTLVRYESQFQLQMDETVKSKEEYNMMQKHLTTLEMAFADIHQKYERSKIVLEGYRTNEIVLKERLGELENKVMEQSKECNHLKEALNDKVKACTNLLKTESDKMQSEVNKYASIIKRLEIKVNSLTSSLEQKTKECTDLATLLDEVTQ